MMGKPVVAAGDQRVIRGEVECAVQYYNTFSHTACTHHADRACCEVLETVFRTRFGTSEQ